MPDKLTDKQVQSLLDAATPGPWEARHEPPGSRVFFRGAENPQTNTRDCLLLPGDARLIAAAPLALRDLQDARAERDEARRALEDFTKAFIASELALEKQLAEAKEQASDYRAHARALDEAVGCLEADLAEALRKGREANAEVERLTAECAALKDGFYD